MDNEVVCRSSYDNPCSSGAGDENGQRTGVVVTRVVFREQGHTFGLFLCFP